MKQKQITSNKRKTDHHQTPKRVIEYLKQYHNIDIEKMYDPCPLHNHLDGLTMTWERLNYVNPPYDKLEEFIIEAVHQNMICGYVTYLLFPLSKTDQAFFHFYLKKYMSDAIYFPFRIQFVGCKKPAFQTHALVRIE